MPTSKACAVVDLTDGEFMGNVPFPSTLTCEVDFSPRGDQLAMVAGNQVVVWDLRQAGVAAETVVSSVCGKFFGWVGDQFLLTQLAGLIDPQAGSTLWHYSVPSNNQVYTMPGGIAAVQPLQLASVLCLPVPHGPVQAVAKQLSGGDDSLMAVVPGSEVELQVNAVAGVDQEVMLQSLKQAVEAAGWKVRNQASIQVVAEIQRGEDQELRFRSIGRMSLGTPRADCHAASIYCQPHGASRQRCVVGPQFDEHGAVHPGTRAG